MKIFTKFGDLIIKLFDFVGMLIFSISGIPNKLRNVDTTNIKGKMNTEGIKENINKFKDDNISNKVSKLSQKESYDLS